MRRSIADDGDPVAGGNLAHASRPALAKYVKTAAAPSSRIEAVRKFLRSTECSRQTIVLIGLIAH